MPGVPQPPGRGATCEGGSRCLRAAAALWVDARAREELLAPTCLRIELWLRTLSDALAPELRREWSGLRELFPRNRQGRG